MNMSVQLERLRNAAMDFLKNQQSGDDGLGVARGKRKSFGVKRKSALVRRGSLGLTLNSNTKGELL
jgi:hypothetical protein